MGDFRESLGLLLALVASACAPVRTPCAGANDCARGTECLAMRCVAEAAEPIAGGTTRRLALPSSMALATDAERAALGGSVTLGNPAVPRTNLYVGFEPVWRDGQVQAAFLLLEPMEGSVADGDVPLEVFRARRAWRGSAFSWSTQPGPATPFARGIARALPPLPVRVDVTELVRFFAAHPKQAHGFVIRAAAATRTGVTLATGTTSGAPPRLDVYLKR